MRIKWEENLRICFEWNFFWNPKKKPTRFKCYFSINDDVFLKSLSFFHDDAMVHRFISKIYLLFILPPQIWSIRTQNYKVVSFCLLLLLLLFVFLIVELKRNGKNKMFFIPIYFLACSHGDIFFRIFGCCCCC